MGNEKLWVEWPTLKTDMSYNPYIRSVKNIWKLHGIEKCYVIFSLNYWLLLY